MYPSAHCPPQKQSCVHGRLDLEHWHLPVHRFLQAHLMSSLQPFDAPGRVLHKGTQIPSLSSFHPHSEGHGRVGLAFSAWSQMCPAWNAACFTCCRSAALDGGMFSSF